MRYSHTKLGVYKGCPRCFYWNYNRRLVRKEKPKYFTEGEVFHEGHKKWYHPTSLFMPPAQRIDSTIEHMKNFCLKNNIPTEVLDLTTRMILSLIKTITPNENFTPISVEQWVEVPLPDVNATYVCRADGIVLDNSSGKLKGLEAKSARAVGNNLINHYKHGPQAQGTIWVLREGLKQPIEAMVFNIVTKAKTPVAMQIDAPVNKWEMDTWLETQQKWIREIESRDPTDVNHWPRNDNNCHSVISGECPYLILEKYGEGNNVTQLFKPYAEKEAGITTDGGI